MTRIPLSTYRLQVRGDFDLTKVGAIASYVHDLGADWLYLSPVLEAEAGSDHGYDLVDHTRVDSARGGAEALEAAARTAHALGLGILVDIVPNHMGVASAAANAWWWDLLTHGRDSRYADAFDVDWEFGDGKVRIPVLASADAAERDALTIVDGELRYHDNRYPLAPGTADDGSSPSEVHARQHYELVHWRRADDELNYRRFFAVNSLAAIRVELPWVFEESHREIARWIREGIVDGLRVDHPDGLADPGAYLDALADLTGGAYVVVEKILESGERLPSAWATAGTTGYDALAYIDRLFVDPEGEGALAALDAGLRGSAEPPSWPALIHETKRAVTDGILRSEVLRIERDLGQDAAAHATTGASISSVADAIAELLTCFPVYRSYLPLGHEQLETAARLAKDQRPDLAEHIDTLLPALGDPADPAAIRFQQTSGMVMAKGVEDCAFYRYTRLGSLTEVGADPSEFSIRPHEFHRRQQYRQAAFPDSLTTLSTHDTKRGEDARARISVLSEMAAEWADALNELRGLAPLGDGPLEALLWQAIIGAWPATRERLHAYAEKAAREAGYSTTWTSPNEPFEDRMHALVDAAFDDDRVTAVIERILERVTPAGWSNGLSAKLVQLMAPGVPDVYQGSELWETSLVDPDNRRPVDFDARRLYLAALDAETVLPPIDETGIAKLHIVSRALRLRRDRPELFTRYVDAAAFGPAARNVVAFDRGGAIAVATRLPLGLAATGGWRDTVLATPAGHYTELFTGLPVSGGSIRLAELLATYPVAVLVPATES